MTQAHRSKTPYAGLAPLGLALLAALGCAGSPPPEDAELTSRRARSHFEMAVDHQKNGRTARALRELLVAERYDPDNPLIQHALGMAYLQKGKVEEAERRLLRSLELQPDYQDARYNLSTLYLKQGRYEEAIPHSKALYDDPTFAAPWRALTNWGWAAYRLGRVEEGRERLETSLEMSPRYWPTLLDLGILEAEQGRKVAAIGYFNQLLALEPGASATAEASYRLAEIYVSLGNREQAVGHLRTAVVKAPSDPWGKKSEEYLKLLR
jgi:tetratricopeptide (TPR) repeat protein